MSDTLASTPECLKCGACCFSELDSYVRVDGDDHERLGDDAETLTIFIGNRCFMRMQDGHCAALSLDEASGEYRCSVYARRPEICRALDRGSPQCQAEITLKGERPGQAMRSLRP